MLTPQVDEQTWNIIQYLSEKYPEYVRQVKWTSNPLMRLLDFFMLGALGRFFLKRGRKASGKKAIKLLTNAIAISSSKTVIAKSLFYRANNLFDGAADADTSIADYSLAIWCEPNDCWSRKNRAAIYETYRESYGKGYEDFQLPMTKTGACADIEAALEFFKSLTKSRLSPENQKNVNRMIHQCNEILEKLKTRP